MDGNLLVKSRCEKEIIERSHTSSYGDTPPPLNSLKSRYYKGLRLSTGQENSKCELFQFFLNSDINFPNTPDTPDVEEVLLGVSSSSSTRGCVGTPG